MHPGLGCSFCLSQAAATARSTWDATGELARTVWCLLGDTGSWVLPVVAPILIHRVHTGTSALGSDFICNLSTKRPLREPQVRARGAQGYVLAFCGFGGFLAVKTGGFLCAPLVVCSHPQVPCSAIFIRQVRAVEPPWLASWE